MPPRNSKEKAAPDQLSFEQALGELEAIVAAMERGEVPLAESLEQYERGVQMIKRCRSLLAQAEKKVELLSENEKGEPATEPLVEPEQQEE